MSSSPLRSAPAYALIVGYDLNHQRMKWEVSRTVFEGLPLLLRYPLYDCIWDNQKKFPNLFSVSHVLEYVSENGLPVKHYNESLNDFDDEVVNLFGDDEGIIILIETFAGKRNYWFYISDDDLVNVKVKKLNEKYQDKCIEFEMNKDYEWSFITRYPVKVSAFIKKE